MSTEYNYSYIPKIGSQAKNEQKVQSNISTTYPNIIPSLDSYTKILNDRLKFDKTQALDMQKQIDFNNKMGTFDMAFSVGKDLFNAWNRYKELKLQKDQYNFSKDMAIKNYNMQKDSYDRQVNRANRIASAYNNM